MKDVTISVTTDDHGSALYNGGLVEELVPPFQDQDQDDEQNSQGTLCYKIIKLNYYAQTT